MLAAAVDAYVAVRRAAGFTFGSEAQRWRASPRFRRQEPCRMSVRL